MSTSRDSRKRDRHESHRDNHVSSVTGEFTRTSRDRDGDSSSNQQRDSNWNGDGNGDGIGNTNGSANGDSDANANAIYRDEGHSDSDHSHSNSHSYGQPHSHHDNHVHISSRAARHQSPRRQDSFGAVQECIHEPLGSGPQRSVEGWVVIVTGCHEEAQEEGTIVQNSDISNSYLSLSFFLSMLTLMFFSLLMIHDDS